MRKANCKAANSAIYKRLAEMQLSERDRQLATYALRDAEAMVHAVIWVKERISAFGARLPKLGFKH